MSPNRFYINKSIRLKEYDYGYPGAYFVTICINEGKCLFGEVVEDKMVLNELGKIADRCLSDIPNHFENTKIPAHIVMPNHVHVIVNIYEEDYVDQTHAFDSQRRAFDLQEDRKHQKLPILIGSYKSAVSKKIHKRFPSANFKWQTSYHDHIIGSERAMENIYNYIEYNPENWDKDLENKKYIISLTAKEREMKLKVFYKGLTRG